MKNTVEQFHLSSIINEKSDNREVIINILKARGFLIDTQDNKFYLSDNSTMCDLKYLEQGMKKYSIGVVCDDGKYITKSRRNWDKYNPYRSYTYKSIQPKKIEILIDDNATIDATIEFFHSVGRNGSEAGPSIRSWREYSIEVFGNKASVEQLEAYVAFYVKAISSCGVYTCYSCDGNHENGGKVFVDSNYPSSLWHKNVWEYIVKPNFGDIPYIGDGITFDKETQTEVYETIYNIATFLYANRFRIRQLKANTLGKFTKKFIDEHGKEELEKYYQVECERVLKNAKIDY